MPTITANAIITKAQIILQDTTSIRWVVSELLGWLNDGQREVCMARPDACTKVSSVPTVAGTKQAVPSDGTAAIKVIRNMGGGSTPGLAIRKVPMELLDSSVPNWHSQTATGTAQHFCVDVRMPKVFYLYPPSNGTNQVELLYAAPPADVAAVGNVISVDDVFAGPLVDYICFRAYSKDNDLIGNADRAKGHRVLFSESMNSKSQADQVVNQARDNIAG